LNPADVMNFPMGLVEQMAQAVAEEQRAAKREAAKARARGR
jgi:outer membrane murein-binding lipoprotein Lpp